jgi:predicted acetyltransferase
MALIELIPATSEQEPILANLLQLYAHDFSEFHDIELEQDGRFEYRDLPLYWREPRRKPFLVKVDGRLVGFVLVKRGSEVSGDETVWDMVEFFVVRRYRRRGVGTEIAHQVWRELPGRWEVRVMPANRSAYDFWGRAIREFTGEVVRSDRFEKNGEEWHFFSFETTPRGVSSRDVNPFPF